MEQDGRHGEGSGDVGGCSHYEGETAKLLCNNNQQARKLSSSVFVQYKLELTVGRL